MAERLGLGPEVRQLKIGQSFTNPKKGFHTIRYDFKPASVDTSKIAAVEVGQNNQVTVTVPHLDGAGVPHTVFKGPQRPYQKECVLIIDRVTGEITLEKLGSGIQLKKTRSELHKPVGRPVTPVESIAQRTSSKTRVASGPRRSHLVPKHSPLHASPSHHPSPVHTKSPKPVVEVLPPTGQGSLPLIGDDFHVPEAKQDKSPAVHHVPEEPNNGVGILSESSSSSSSDSSSSDSESERINKTVIQKSNGTSSGQQQQQLQLPPMPRPTSNGAISNTDMLQEDLCLSESGSDSD